MAEQEQLASLQRMRRLATGLLVLMALVFIGARLLQGRHPWLAFVAAFAEAAMVGALADWFAVTALFRRPFGLPIPHTAIIPRNKDRIAESIGNFLEHNFITEAVLTRELAEVDFTGVAAHWLAVPENGHAIARQVSAMVPGLLKLVDDDDVGRFLRSALSSGLSEVRLAPLGAQVLSVLVSGGKHQKLLDRVVGVVASALEEQRPYIRQKVHDNSPRWIPKSIDEKFFERLMDGVQGILTEIQGADSVWRARFQATIEDFIVQLEQSPDYEAKLQRLLARGLADPLFRTYVGRVWSDVRQRLLADAASDDSLLARRVESGLRIASRALLEDASAQARLNGWLRSFAIEAIVARRSMIAAVVTRAIHQWDAETVSRKLELQVGRDLQFIRINGTVVGGVAGLLLYCLSLLLF